MTYSESLKLREEFAHYVRSNSLLHEFGNGDVIEYRRIFTPDRPAVFIEHRVLGPGGHPFNDGWYLVCDVHWRHLIYNAHELLDELCSL